MWPILPVLLTACQPKVSEGATDPGDGGNADTASPGDGGAADGGQDTGFCVDVPAVTWANFGAGFMLGSCQGCHASTAVERYGAPEDVTFDTVDQVWTHASAVLWAATGDDPFMPPEGGVSEDDRTRLEWWLRCAEPGT